MALAIYQGAPFFLLAATVFATVGRADYCASLTAFTGFPVIASSLADQYLPVFFTQRGFTRRSRETCAGAVDILNFPHHFAVSGRVLADSAVHCGHLNP